MPFHVLQLAPTEEIFTWVDPDTGHNLHFAVTQLRRLVEGVRHCEAEFPITHKDFLEQNRGVDPARSAALTEEQLKDPVIVLIMPDKTNLLVDGTHRVHRHLCDGNNLIPTIVIPEEVWKEFLVLGLPNNYTEAEILAKPAGPLPHRKPL